MHVHKLLCVHLALQQFLSLDNFFLSWLKVCFYFQQTHIMNMSIENCPYSKICIVVTFLSSACLSVDDNLGVSHHHIYPKVRLKMHSILSEQCFHEESKFDCLIRSIGIKLFQILQNRLDRNSSNILPLIASIRKFIITNVDKLAKIKIRLNRGNTISGHILSVRIVYSTFQK